jgi:hypothetical protein
MGVPIVNKLLWDVIENFLQLLAKLLGSTKVFFQIVSKLFALLLIFKLTNETHIVIIFLISSILDLAYFGVVTFEKVKTDINIGKSI